jgi:hypothetical protein
VVDFRSRILAFRGARGEPPRALPVQESHLSRSSRRTRKAATALHRTKKMLIFIFEESRTLLSNQLVNEENKKRQKATTFWRRAFRNLCCS